MEEKDVITRTLETGNDRDVGTLLSPNVNLFVPLAVLTRGHYSTVTLLQLRGEDKPSRVGDRIEQSYYTGHLWTPPMAAAQAKWEDTLAHFADVAKHLNHPGVRHFAELQKGPAGTWLLFDYVNGCPADKLGDLRSRLDPRRIILWLHGMLEAVHYLHGHNIVMGGIEPSSIILTAKGPVLVDLHFLERAFPETMIMKTSKERATFMAPEARSSVLRVPQHDVFGVAAAAFWMLTGEAPNVSSPADTEALMNRLRAARPSLPTALNMALTEMLAFQPSQRPKTAHDAAARIARWKYNEADLPELPASMFTPPSARPEWLPKDSWLDLTLPVIKEVPAEEEEPPPPPSAPKPKPEEKQPEVHEILREHAEDALWNWFDGSVERATGVLTGLLIIVILLCYAALLHEPPQSASAGRGFLQIVEGTTESIHVMGNRRWQTVRSVSDDQTELRALASSDHTRATFGNGSSVRMTGRSSFLVCAHQASSLTLMPLQGRLWIQTAPADQVLVYVPGATVKCGAGCSLELIRGEKEVWTVLARKGDISVSTDQAAVTINERHGTNISADGRLQDASMPQDDKWVEWNASL